MGVPGFFTTGHGICHLAFFFVVINGCMTSYIDLFAFGGGGKMKEESEESEKGYEHSIARKCREYMYIYIYTHVCTEI